MTSQNSRLSLGPTPLSPSDQSMSLSQSVEAGELVPGDLHSTSFI